MEKAVSFKNSKGQKLSGVTHTPAGTGKFPAIICCHGFSRNKIDKFRMWVRIARELCKNGFFVLRFDFSGHGDSEGEIDDFLISQGIDDLERAINYLEKLPKVNKDKVGIIGHSLGGEIAILEAAKNPAITAVVLLAPVVDYRKLLGDFPRAFKEAEERETVELACHMMKKQYFAEMRKFRPLVEAGKINAPVLVIHGDADDRVEISGSKELAENLSEPKNLVVMNGADHDFFGYCNTMQMIRETVAWFRESMQ